jgi:hypothetical protein
MSMRRTLFATAVAALLLTGCGRAPAAQDAQSAQEAGATPTVSVPTSPVVPPPAGDSTLPPVGTSTGQPPKTASDNSESGWIVGSITAGGGGPCYALETDDGVQYSLYGSAGMLAKGQRVRVRIAGYSGAAAACGPGTKATIVKLEKSG